MRIIGIGDIHGSNSWKDILNQEKNFDKVVFIGDYFDSFHINGMDQISNFKDILKFKRDNFDKVVLLIGNHDYHYLSGINERYSGYQAYLRFDIESLLEDNMDCLQMCYQYNDFLFTHAGVTNTWVKNTLNDFISKKGIDFIDDFNNKYNLMDKINQMFILNYKLFGFIGGKKHDQYGDEICQSPLWVRPNSLKSDGVSGYTHVVGHTFSPLTIDDSIILIDSLGRKEYLIIDSEVDVFGSIISSNEIPKIGTW